jgi:Fe-S oxidoreductase
MVLRLQETALSWKYVSKLSSDAKWKDTTRARANALREYLTHSEKDNKFNHKELYDVLSCVSCKACASECPSNVDVAALKWFYTNTKRPMVFAAK